MKEWHSPNTYNNNFAIPEAVGGVYAIFGYRLPYDTVEPKVLECIYVGASTNLYKRYLGHPVRSNSTFWWNCFYWKQCDNPFEVEILLIKRLKPLLNKRHNSAA